VWNSYVDMLDSLGMDTGYSILPRAIVPEMKQLGYWETLDDAGLLAVRFCGFDNVDPDLIMEYMEGSTHTFFIIDTGSKGIVAEFTLENFLGKAAQMHFSGHPCNSPKLNKFLSEAVSDQVLNEWKDEADTDKPFVESLFGLTPVENRVAVIFAMRCGFKKLGVIPGVIPNGDDYSPATLTVKTRGN